VPTVLVIGVAAIVTIYPVRLLEMVAMYATVPLFPLDVTGRFKNSVKPVKALSVGTVSVVTIFILPISAIVVVTVKLSMTGSAKIVVVAMARIRRVVSIVFFILCSLRRVAPAQDLVFVPFS